MPHYIYIMADEVEVEVSDRDEGRFHLYGSNLDDTQWVVQLDAAHIEKLEKDLAKLRETFAEEKQ